MLKEDRALEIAKRIVALEAELAGLRREFSDLFAGAYAEIHSSRTVVEITPSESTPGLVGMLGKVWQVFADHPDEVMSPTQITDRLGSSVNRKYVQLVVLTLHKRGKIERMGRGMYRYARQPVSKAG